MHGASRMSETRVEACLVLVIYNYLMLSVRRRWQFPYTPHSQLILERYSRCMVIIIIVGPQRKWVCVCEIYVSDAATRE